MSILVIQTSFLGDTVLTTPLLAYLAASGVGPVDVVTIPQSTVLLANHPAVREVIVYDKRGRDAGVSGLIRMALRLRRAHYGAAYLAQGSVRSGALAWLAGIPVRAGFDRSAGRWFYNRRIAYDATAHHAKRLLSLATGSTSAIGGSEIRPRLYPGAQERDAVDALLEADGYDGEPLIALAPGSVWATKRWPYYPALARALAGDARIVVIGAPGDTSLARAIFDAAGPSVIDATGKLSLLASAELIGRARLLVSNDSAPQHLASAMGTPTVTIFGPTAPEFGFGPLAPGSAVIQAGLACQPCDRHGPQRCPLGHLDCMRTLSPERVLAVVRAHLPTRDFQDAD